MEIVCLDLEGVLVPEIWIAFAEATGIPDFRRTTRDEPDYDKLMHYRIDLLDKHGFNLKQIQDVIRSMRPLIGAEEFLEQLRERTQVLILSDTFDQFSQPLMKKLNWPAIFCNSLTVENGDTIAAGDSYNDLGMIRASKAGFLFRSTPEIKAANPDIPAFETYDDFLAAIFKNLSRRSRCSWP